MPKSWKSEATRLYKRVVAAKLWSDELMDRNYSGAGGAVHPNGRLRQDLDLGDVAWEQLYEDCVHALEETHRK